jgi:hypothetical protein
MLSVGRLADEHAATASSAISSTPRTIKGRRRKSRLKFVMKRFLQVVNLIGEHHLLPSRHSLTAKASQLYHTLGFKRS